MEKKLKLLQDTFQNEYSMSRFIYFVKEFFIKAEFVEPKKKYKNTLAEYSYIISHTHVADYTDDEQNKIAILAVALRDGENELVRNMQRDFIARFILKRKYDGAIAAFYNENEPFWKFSLIRIESAVGTDKANLNLASRYSYLAGKGEPCYTAVKQLYPVFRKADFKPTLDKIQECFSVEAVNKDFFNKYCAKYHEISEKLIKNKALDKIQKTAQLAVRILRQVLILYFLQKKGLLSVREMFEKDERMTYEILEFFECYNFTLKEDEPLEREVAINPAMLSQIFENMLEVKERKSKGIFYTPPEIVRYMCQQSLIHYLVSKTGLDYDCIQNFVFYGITEENKIIYEQLSNIDKALSCLKVADPAAGSGAFPLGMLSEIVKARTAITAYFAQQESDSIEQDNLLKKTRSPYKIKCDTVKNSIFAVDIEADAANICKLRLWLAVTADGEDNNINFSLLRNIERNIRCGNSLTDELGLFKERGGFDIVIGNPPYIDSEAMVLNGMTNMRDIIASRYSMARGNWDIYIPFFELGFRLLSPNGTLIYLTPDKWISKPFGDELRKQLIPYISSVLKVGRNAFSSAKVDAIVAQFNKTIAHDIKVYNYINGAVKYQRKVSKAILSCPFTLDIVFSKSLNILAKIEQDSVILESKFTCESACATSDAYKLKEIVREVGHKVEFDSGKHLKIVNTGTIDKYLSKWGVKKMTYLGSEYLYPIAKKEEFFERFKKSYARKAIRPKILIKGLSLLDACLDDAGTVIPGKSTLVIADEDINNLKFLLAIINSQLAKFYISEKYSASTYNGGLTFTKRMINGLPIKQVTDKQKEEIIKLVDMIIYNKSKDWAYDTTRYEKAINKKIYRWHNLTEAEIDIIEGYKQDNPAAMQHS